MNSYEKVMGPSVLEVGEATLDVSTFVLVIMSKFIQKAMNESVSL